MRISKATFIACEYACINFHYAKRTPVINCAFNIFNDDDEWCGVIIYGSGATPHLASPYDKWQGQVLELVRVALNGKQGHGNTSKAVSLTLRRLKEYRPWCDLVVSYADLDQNHVGTLYQATNWVYTGVVNADTRGSLYRDILSQPSTTIPFGIGQYKDVNSSVMKLIYDEESIYVFLYYHIKSIS